MIAHLAGTVLVKTGSTLILDVGGVGYELFAGVKLLAAAQVDAPLAVFTFQLFREEGQSLYAFATLEERRLFALLLKVNGIGAKTALLIVSELGAAKLAEVIAQREVRTLTRLPGIGQKTADRLLIELAGKLEFIAPTAANAEAEVFAALLALGYSERAIPAMIARAQTGALQSTEALLRAVLKTTLNP